MEHHGRRFHDEGRGRIHPQIESELHTDARTSARDRACKPAEHWTVYVATEDSLHLCMPLNNAGQLPSARKDLLVHMADGRSERWVVHENDSGPIPAFRKNLIQPGKPPWAEAAAVLSQCDRIQAHKTNRKFFHSEADIVFPLLIAFLLFQRQFVQSFIRAGIK